MFRLRCLKTPSLRRPGAKLSSPLLSPCYPLALSAPNPSFTKNLTTSTINRLPPRQLSDKLDPKSLMMDLESEIFNYTTGHFLHVSSILFVFV
jgi:hypothetical protein